VLPGNLGGRGIALIALVLVVLWGFSGFFRVEPDELGVVLRFGKFTREVQPGLNYHLPYPIETALTPQALRVNKIDIGMRESDDMRRGTTQRDVPEESLMLTGDENIVDVDFSVLWKVKPSAVGDYLFNIQNPEGTVKAVAESAMREVIGHSNIQPILTGARQNIETAVQELMQKTLDDYGAGILVQQVQLQKVDPPTQVIDAFRDVQAARSDLERAQNEAQTYANRVVPEARGRAAKITRTPKPIASRPSPTPMGQTSRFLQVYDQYKKAPDVTRERMYLETMERVFGGTDKTIIDTGAATGRASCRICRSTSFAPPQAPSQRPGGRQAMRNSLVGGVAAVLLLSLSSSPTAPSSPSTRPGRRWWCGSAARARHHRARAQRESAVHRQRDLYRQAHSRRRIAGAGGDRLQPGQFVPGAGEAGERLVVDAFARYRIADPLKFYQTVGPTAPIRSCDSAQLGAAPRARRGHACRRGAQQARAADGADARSARSRCAAVRHSRRRRAYPPRRSAGTEQPGGLPAHADRTAARGGRVPRPGQPEEPGNPRQGRSRRHRAAGRRQSAVRADPRPGRRRAQPHLRRRL
jgi:membrane protease subunit HflK